TDLAADMARAARVAEEFAALGALDLEGHEGTAHAHAVRGRLDPADAEVRAHTRFPARRGLGIELLVESGRTARRARRRRRVDQLGRRRGLERGGAHAVDVHVGRERPGGADAMTERAHRALAALIAVHDALVI